MGRREKLQKGVTCVTITVHVPTPCRCSLLAATVILCQDRSAGGSMQYLRVHLSEDLRGWNPSVYFDRGYMYTL